MSNIREYVGCKSIEAVNYDGKGNTLCNMWVTDEEIVRCRDCEFYFPDRSTDFDDDCDGNVCGRTYIEVEPNGFCKWGERR